MPDTLTFTSGTELHGFVVESVEPLSEIDGTAIVMRHAQSGARLLFLRNEDENKAFSISFKTPPTDNTGVFHILEHSVLCGSDKFPVKEPFVNLLKTSMQTFLNALTFPDKTMYPVASTNGQDLLNLIDVYMDAVLHPAIYTKPEIFQQEGWHYELDGFAGEGDAEGAAAEANGEAWVGEDAEAVVTGEVAGGEVAALDEVEAQAAASALQPRAERLRYNGVVFNEMKGALSDPDSVLYRAVNAALFPDTCYACESGGDPRSIPQLTYEQFLDTHARHYRLDNSYMVLYGALDAEAVLGFLDERYLSAPDCAPRTQAAPDEIGTQEPLVACDVVVPMDTVAENACVGAGYVIGEAADFERVLACDVLLDALMGGNESPIKRAILDAGLGGDATAYLVDSQAQPVALFQLKNAFTHSGAGQVESIQDAAGQGEGAQDALAPEAASAPIDAVAQQFMALVESEVCALVQGGIPRDLLEASLSQMAFDLRERDRGMADGVPLAMNALAGWLYDDAMPTTYLRYEDALAHMRAGLETRYFEDVLERLILGSNHKALVEVRPQKTGAAAAEAAELEATRAGMSARDKQDVCRQVAALRAMQETPDTPEALAALPQLHVADIGPAMPDPAVELCAVTPLPCLFHNMPTRHIDYVYAYFGVDHLTWEDLPYVTLLTMLLTRLDTARHTAAELDVLMRSRLGSLRFFADAYVADNDPSAITLKMALAASALSEELEHVPAIAREVWESTQFSDAAKVRDILVQRKISMEQSFAGEGNVRAMNRVASYHFDVGVVREAMSGIDFYLFLKDLLEHFDERFDALVARLESVRSRVFTSHDIMVSFTGSPEEHGRFWDITGTWGLQGGACEGEGESVRAGAPEQGEPAWKTGMPAPYVKNEAFIVPSDVNYVAQGSDVLRFGPYKGLWAVASNALNFDYLWNEVRVKGGAYGAGFRMLGQGSARFYSYRDPEIDATLHRFNEAGGWLASFDPTPEEMEGYVVSTVASHDAPVKPRQIARRQDALYFSKRPADYRERLRAEKLAATSSQLRDLAPVLKAVAQDGAVCVFGNEASIRAAKTELNIVELLK